MSFGAWGFVHLGAQEDAGCLRIRCQGGFVRGCVGECAGSAVRMYIPSRLLHAVASSATAAVPLLNSWRERRMVLVATSAYFLILVGPQILGGGVSAGLLGGRHAQPGSTRTSADIVL